MTNTKATATITLPQNRVIGHHTTKTPKGFRFTVSLIGYEFKTVILKEVDGYRSRAIATARGKAWKMHLKDCQKKSLTVNVECLAPQK